MAIQDSDVRIARMLPEQIQEVSDLADFIYPDTLGESAEVFRSCQRLFPQGAIVLEDSKNLLHIWGYCFFHPWHDAEYVPLNHVRTAVPRSRTAYIHDLALHPDIRGQGYGINLVCNVLDRIQSQGFRRCTLVAVLSTEEFWAAVGFTAIKTLEYGAGEQATHMAMPL